MRERISLRKDVLEFYCLLVMQTTLHLFFVSSFILYCQQISVLVFSYTPDKIFNKKSAVFQQR
jgi:hypothetical protein